MLGKEIADAGGVEAGGRIKGVGLLSVKTELKPEKVRRQVRGTIGKLEGIFSVLSGRRFEGYEIHMGQSVKETESLEKEENVFITGRYPNVYGTYVHGIFDKGEIVSALVGRLAAEKGIVLGQKDWGDYRDFKEKQYDKLADILAQHLNMEEVYGMLKEAHMR